MYYVFVQDRESGKWYFTGHPEWYNTEIPNPKRYGHYIKVRKQESWISPVPEKVSAFIKQHKIIEANTEEEAWQKLSLI